MPKAGGKKFTCSWNWNIVVNTSCHSLPVHCHSSLSSYLKICFNLWIRCHRSDRGSQLWMPSHDKDCPATIASCTSDHNVFPFKRHLLNCCKLCDYKQLYYLWLPLDCQQYWRGWNQMRLACKCPVAFYSNLESCSCCTWCSKTVCYFLTCSCNSYFRTQAQRIVTYLLPSATNMWKGHGQLGWQSGDGLLAPNVDYVPLQKWTRNDANFLRAALIVFKRAPAVCATAKKQVGMKN